MLITNPSCTGGDTPGNCNSREHWGLEGNALAMVYSPKQYWRKLYSPADALARGTLFTELDMPLEVRGGDEK